MFKRCVSLHFTLLFLHVLIICASRVGTRWCCWAWWCTRWWCGKFKARLWSCLVCGLWIGRERAWWSGNSGLWAGGTSDSFIPRTSLCWRGWAALGQWFDIRLRSFQRFRGFFISIFTVLSNRKNQDVYGALHEITSTRTITGFFFIFFI